MSEQALNVLEGPALGLLVQLEAKGFSIAAVGDRLKVKPISRLAAEQRADLERHRREILMLLRICDETVQARREAFVAQLAALGDSIPAFVFRRGIYAPGACYSCGEELDPRAYSRCWRCVLALRLAFHAPIPADFVSGCDEARIA